MMEKLKPCPFCGSQYVKLTRGIVGVHCYGCNANVDFTEWDEAGYALYKTVDEMVKAWNRRADDGE